MNNTNSFTRQLLGLSLIIAPILFGASTFFWQNGEYGVVAGTLIVLSQAFWIPAFIALFGLIKNKMPYYYPIGLFIAFVGCCVGGVSFGLLGYFTTIFHIDHKTYLTTLAQYPLSANLLLFWTGPLFPLSLLVLGINLIRKKALPFWVGLLIALSGIVFPLSRIPRIEWVAHLADLLLTIPLVYVGVQFLRPVHELGA